MARKVVDPLKAKQKKQKILAAVLGVVFLAVAAFQGPRLWKQMHPKNAGPRPSYDQVASTTTTPGSPSLVAPSLSGNQAPTMTPSTGSLTSTPVPTLADGQLTSFSRFASKDPFAQQLDEDKQETSTPSAGGATKTPSASNGGGSSGGGASDPTPGTAVISVNGTLYTVAVGNDFPQSTDSSVAPLFHLVSLTAHTAKISIVGGSYSSGASTVTLQENKPVTLMNTADGTRYKLILKPVGTAVPTAAPTTAPTSTTVTVPPPSP